MARRAAVKESQASEEELIKEAFGVFDTDKDGLLKPAEIVNVVRALGKNPTQAEADEMAKEAGGPVNVDQIVKFCKKKFPKPTDQDRGMRAAFEALDKDGNGTIMEAELRQILTTLGEPLTMRELDLIMREIQTDNYGNVYYDTFVDKLVE